MLDFKVLITKILSRIAAVPTSLGTSGYVLRSNGASSEPTWTAQSNLSVGSADMATCDTSGEKLYGQTASTTWKKPTVISSAITIDYGGYYEEGKHCYVQMRCTLAAELAANTSRQIASMPAPEGVPEAALSILVYNRGGHACRITGGGILQIISDVDHAITANQIINITGVYTTA